MPGLFIPCLGTHVTPSLQEYDSDRSFGATVDAAGAGTPARHRRTPTPRTRPTMLLNYLRIALRNLRRRKLHTFINVLSLAAGLGCCFLVGLFIRHELSFDRFHTNADRIYRLVETFREEGVVVEQSASVPFPVGPALANAYGVTAARLYRPYQETPVVRVGSQRFTEHRFFFADSTVFDVFSFELLKGDPATALDEPGTVVLTASTAHRYFGDRDPMGQVLQFEEALDLRVTGVVADPPANAHFRFDALAALQDIGRIVATADVPVLEELWDDWYWNPAHTYLLLPPDRTAESFEPLLAQFVQAHFPEDVRDKASYHLQPLTHIHLHSDLYQEIEPNGSARLVSGMGLIAILVLLIAGVNFVNLSTAQSLSRATEVGLRKTLGAAREQLIGQFLGEAVLMALLAALVGVTAALAAVPAFGALLGAELSRWAALDPVALGLLALLTGTVGVLAGLYPALVLSSHEPAQTLRGFYHGGGSRSRLREGLVVGQFAISIVLLVATLVVHHQLRYLQQKELGFANEQILMVPIAGTPASDNVPAFKGEVRRNPSVVDVAAVSEVVGRDVVVGGFKFEGIEDVRNVPVLFADPDFFTTFAVDVAEGRGFDAARPADSTACLMNQQMARELGWTGTAVGRRIESDRYDRIIGVMEDFHFTPLREGVRPLVLCHNAAYEYYLAVRLAPGRADDAFAAVEQTWAQVAPGWPFQGFFLDDDLDRLYRQEQQLGQAFGVVAGLALFIGCLGLFGQAAYAAEQRRKEMGVRKVLGASASGLVLLFVKESVMLVGLAFALAAPVAYLLMQRWLADFAYRVGVPWWVFAVAGLAALAVAIMTVGYHAATAALRNPVHSLRSE